MIVGETLGVNLTAFLLFICIMLVLMIVKGIGKRKSTFPKDGNLKPVPGPPGLLLVGNIFDIDSNAQQKSMQRLAEKYGNIFQIRIFRTPVVVLNGYDAISQALKHQAIDFAGRPHFHTFKVMHELKSGFLAFADYDETWKAGRKIAETALKTFVSGRNVESLDQRIGDEVRDLIAVLTDNNNTEGRVLEPSTMIKLSVCNIMFSYMFGSRRSYSDSKLHDFLAMSHRFTNATGTGNIIDFLPWLRFLPSKTMSDFKGIILELRDILSDDIKRHKENHVQGVSNNICDQLLNVSRSMNQSELRKCNIDEERVMSSVYDMVGAAFDTISMSLTWSLVLMVNYPDVQAAVHDELLRVVGHKTPTLKDKPSLPFTEACILETLRFITVVPFSIPHSTTRDTTLNGYFIPKGTTVFVNLHSVHHDKTRWVNPESFNPARFLSKDGSLDRQKVDQIMPFSAGRRRCLGSDLAKTELFLFFSNLLHQCHFESATAEKIPMEPIHGLTVRPKPFKLKIRPRFPGN
ncbi:cytochrome P450 1A1-like [Anneissia japonica]|uniref:cytochrome P450 1A1-like n=1 Tax=Anneissia japonica TaxID=1529436 RepID=UPI001425A232|nr:cytochrome P450 1A1-like [Anneissia japonica]